MSGTVGNADKWTAVFKDGNNLVTDPDGDVTWTVTVGRTDSVTTQTLAQKVSTGTFELKYTPTSDRPYSVKVSAVVGGVSQSPDTAVRPVNP